MGADNMDKLLRCLNIYGFPLEFFVSCVVLMIRLKKRSLFPVRVCACFLVQLLFNLPFMMFSSSEKFRVAGFFALYLLEIGVFLFCTEVSLWDGIFGTACAHSIQHLAYVISGCAAVIHPMEGWPAFGSRFLIYFLTVLLCIFVFIPKLSRSGRFHVEKKEALRTVFIVLLFAFGMNLLSDQLILHNPETSRGILLILRIYAAFCCVFALWIQAATNEKAAIESELKIRELLWNRQKEQYDLSRENIDLINQKCHDLKHQLNAFRHIPDESKRQEYCKKMEESIMIYDSVVKTGNQVLDTIFTERSLACEKEGITWTCMADGSQLNFMDPVDLYTIFGNALDNAIECVRKLTDPEFRVVAVSLFVRDQLSILQVENYYSGTIEMKDGLPESTKQDWRYHGYGMKSIRFNVERYGGTISIDLKDQIFLLTIMIPVPSPSGSKSGLCGH